MRGATRRTVRERAGGRCEYCRLPEASFPATFHIEHVVPRQHGGGEDLGNLALACPLCNCLKGANLSAIDPETGAIVLLFDPRRDRWEDHFGLQGHELRGRSPTGRATVRLLAMNDEQRQTLRRELAENSEL